MSFLRGKSPLKVISSSLAKLLLLTLLSGVVAFARADSTVLPTIAIIIDDMGNRYQEGQGLINLPYPMTFAFLPKRPYTNMLSRQAHELNKEIILHEPMENEAGLALGVGGLTRQMNRQQLAASFRRSLASIPFAVGINNHMGSKLTRDWQRMDWLMSEIRKHRIFFVDSRTIGSSVAAQVAGLHGIPHLSRDVFLDHEQTREFVRDQFHQLLKIAREKGTAVAIGHPHQVTLDYLAQALPKLDRKGIRIATVSALWQIKHPKMTMFEDRKTPLATPSAFKLAMKQSSVSK